PKRSLTGASTERVDTRVLQILYSFEREALPVFVGQQVDVFIEAPPIAEPVIAAGPSQKPAGSRPPPRSYACDSNQRSLCSSPSPSPPERWDRTTCPRARRRRSLGPPLPRRDCKPSPET